MGSICVIRLLLQKRTFCDLNQFLIVENRKILLWTNGNENSFMCKRMISLRNGFQWVKNLFSVP